MSKSNFSDRQTVNISLNYSMTNWPIHKDTLPVYSSYHTFLSFSRVNGGSS